MKLNVSSDCFFFVIPWLCWNIPAKITTDCMKLFKRQHPQAETREQYRLMLQNTRMKSRGRLLFLCHVILVLHNSYIIRVNSPVLLIHHKEILLFTLGVGGTKELRFWLVGVNTSPLNQSQHLPLCSCTWKEKSLLTVSERHNFDGGDGHFIGHTLTNKWRLTTDKDIRLVVLHISFQVSRGGHSKTKWSIITEKNISWSLIDLHLDVSVKLHLRAGNTINTKRFIVLW